MQHPSSSTTNVIIYGPQGCGKTRNAEALAAHFGCTSIVDNWDGESEVPDGALALTSEPAPFPFVPFPFGPMVLELHQACQLARIRS